MHPARFEDAWGSGVELKLRGALADMTGLSGRLTPKSPPFSGPSQPSRGLQLQQEELMQRANCW
jgi:hypothetical protein